jgi:oxygen-independent coproporphyrinogen III oxidase
MPGVYLSFPFCAQKCSFCNFASGVFPRELESHYIQALVREIGGHSWEWTPETLYLGGGTPSIMDLDALERVLQAIPGYPWREATIEAAPGSITREKAGVWRRIGFNRVSLGAQSFVQRELARTGRRHTAGIVAADCELLRAAGIHDLNIDLIAGLPHQTGDSWLESLDWIRRLAPPHVSVYMFEVDEDSRLGLEVLNNGARYDAGSVPSGDAAATMYEAAVETLRSIGIERYEISNFAKSGSESLHNTKYWTMAPYAGFGADAHSFDGHMRSGNVESAREYVDRIMRGVSPVESRTPSNVDEERLFTGLRLTRGVRLSPAEWNRHRASIQRFVDAELIEADAGVLRLTSRGVLLSNEVFQEFLAA